MGQNFIACDRDQVLLLPPDLREWLPAGHLALFVIDVVEELDLGGFYGAYREDGQGRAAHDPAMMVALVVYAYAKGVRSAREIERRCVEDVAFRVIAANRAPDHSTVARFLVAFELQLAGLFSQVLALCARAGLARAGVVAVDSTKLNANASGLANRTYEQLAAEIVAEGIATDRAEDELYGERRGDELPAELADPRTRKQRLREAKAQLEREWQAEREAYERHQAWRAGEEAKRGRKLGGRKPKPPPEQPAGRVNLTDPDSRPVKTPRGFIQGYNAQLVCNEQQIVLAAEIKNSTMDQGMLEPMLARAGRELAAVGVADGPELVLADAGYWRTGQIRTLRDRGVKVLVPPDAHTRAEPLPGKRAGIYGWMRERLDTPEGRELYRRRQTIIEPVFGDTKFNRRADRFRRRGLAACRAEWQLITATGNLLKLWRHASALQAI
jgi:transposase